MVYLSSSGQGAHLKAFIPGKCVLSSGVPVLPYACFLAIRCPKENLQFSAVTPGTLKTTGLPWYPSLPTKSKYYPKILGN